MKARLHRIIADLYLKGMSTGSILETKGMHGIFQKKGKERAKKC